MAKGTVKWFDEEKGFGFIVGEEDNKDYFIHRSNVNTMNQALEQGERVEFEVTEGPKGPMAANVTTVE